jgi:hypothetical protein
MKNKETLEELAEKLQGEIKYGASISDIIDTLTKWQQEQDNNKFSEEEMLKLLHKFGFDYTYNYKGEKTIYEWIPEWFEEYKRLLTI